MPEIFRIDTVLDGCSSSPYTNIVLHICHFSPCEIHKPFYGLIQALNYDKDPCAYVCKQQQFL